MIGGVIAAAGALYGVFGVAAAALGMAAVGLYVFGIDELRYRRAEKEQARAARPLPVAQPVSSLSMMQPGDLRRAFENIREAAGQPAPAKRNAVSRWLASALS